MKKAIKLIALSLVLVMAVLALASCAAPNADPAKAKENLEKLSKFIGRKILFTLIRLIERNKMDKLFSYQLNLRIALLKNF